MRKVPGFCCHAPGGAEGLLCDLQERAFIGSSWFLLCLRQSPLGSSVSISSRCRNHVSPIRCTLEPCNAYLVELAGIEPASSTHPLQLLQWISPLPRSCSLRADESPLVFTSLMRSLFNDPVGGRSMACHSVPRFRWHGLYYTRCLVARQSFCLVF